MHAAIPGKTAHEIDHSTDKPRMAWMRFRAFLPRFATDSMSFSSTSVRGSEPSPKPVRHKLLTLAAEMLQRHKTLTIAVMSIRDLSEIEEVFGHSAAKRTLAIAVDGLASLSSNGRVIRAAPTSLAVLLPGWESKRAVGALHSAFGDPCRIELEVDRQGIVVLPEFAAATASGGAPSLEEIYRDLCCAVSSKHRSHRTHRSNTAAGPLPIERESAERAARFNDLPIPPTVPIKLDRSPAMPARLDRSPVPPTVPIKLDRR